MEKDAADKELVCDENQSLHLAFKATPAVVTHMSA